tara:strand:+ start:36201 stop:36833 length:633 start_codon:yes stop_codon:yes gene_type:complete
MEFSQPVDSILKEKKITDYLNEKGILPTRQFADKQVYRCPVHTSDKDPSFTVYFNEDKGYETYYCFGCQSGGSIIQLISAIENIPVKDIVKDFASEFKIDNKTALELACGELDNLLQYHPIKENSLLLKLSNMCYLFLKEVSFDEEEFEFIDNIFQKIDKIIRDKDTETLDKIYNFLSDEGLTYRCSQFFDKKEEEELETAKERELWENA